MKMIMRYLHILLLSALIPVQISAQNDGAPPSEQKLPDPHNAILCEKALELSDAYFKEGKFDQAAQTAVQAYEKAKELGRKDLMAIALNKEAKATVNDKHVKKTDRLAALAKFGKSLELITASKIENIELEKDNLEHLQKVGESMVLIFDKSDVQKVLNVCLDSVRKDWVALPANMTAVPRPPAHPSRPGSEEGGHRHDRQMEFQQKIMELNLARIENELRGKRFVSTPARPAVPELEALSMLPDLKERWIPTKEAIEKEFAKEIRKIELMDPLEAKEELLLAEYKNKYDSLAYLHTLDSINLEKKEMALRQKEAEVAQQKTRKSLMMVGSGSTLAVSFLLLFGLMGLKKNNKLLSQKNEKIQEEQQRSEGLLLNILPSAVAHELKQYGEAKAHRFDEATVLFSDFQNFTRIAEELSPEKLIADLDHCFKAFDRITEKYRLEKIKTIGDAYLCAGGLPTPDPQHAVRTVQAALEMQQFLQTWKEEKMAKGEKYFEARIGIHTGPVIAGVVGVKKFAYDIWGDTVNIASRMESSGTAGQVNISGTTYGLVERHFKCTHRGKIAAKHKGEIDMYFVEGAREA